MRVVVGAATEQPSLRLAFRSYASRAAGSPKPATDRGKASLLTRVKSGYHRVSGHSGRASDRSAEEQELTCNGRVTAV